MRFINGCKELKDRHAKAIISRIEADHDKERITRDIEGLGIDDIEKFILADVYTMRNWVASCADKLQFRYFNNMYSSLFSNGTSKTVYEGYNAYEFIEKLDVWVCPYCDNEELDILNNSKKKKRTIEIDHFFPRSKYPALAMCFYNLVPSGKQCNELKNISELAFNPYEKDIEEKTHISVFPNIPFGQIIDTDNINNYQLVFNPQKGMKRNIDVLCLKDRYNRYVEEAIGYLQKMQYYSKEKINELSEELGISEERIISWLFGPQEPEKKKKRARQKMLFDLTGY